LAFDKADIYVASVVDGEFWQGEILSGTVEYQWSGSDDPDLVEHALAAILSADCDLTQDHRARSRSDASFSKLLPNVLLCDLFEGEELRTRSGTAALNSTVWTNAKQNNNARYHYLSQVPPGKDLQGAGLDYMAMDFKRYFCISTEHLLDQITKGTALRRCRLGALFAQHLALRFCHYQNRVGLPIEHHEA
jgi:hypothetical protein